MLTVSLLFWRYYSEEKILNVSCKLEHAFIYNQNFCASVDLWLVQKSEYVNGFRKKLIFDWLIITPYFPIKNSVSLKQVANRSPSDNLEVRSNLFNADTNCTGKRVRIMEAEFIWTLFSLGPSELCPYYRDVRIIELEVSERIGSSEVLERSTTKNRFCLNTQIYRVSCWVLLSRSPTYSHWWNCRGCSYWNASILTNQEPNLSHLRSCFTHDRP